ncbi:MAG: heat-inducible transcription repressor HrcA, partial [Coxiellaceae bacterium]|nr:heat-inducible transcription repressor HrcA [Coxiellaceae bacterium]
MSNHDLDERSLNILHHLVESYINDGQPVGSKALAERARLPFSSATIRNIMADLEAEGFLVSPHTSSGRVPTLEGYRMFANQLLTAQSPSEFSLEMLRDALNSEAEETGLIERASTLLSQVTQLAGVVTMPKHEQLILKQVEFLYLSERRVLVVLVLNDYQVQNRVIEIDREFSRRELEEAGNYLTQCFSGKDLLKARKDLLLRMQEERADLEAMLKTVMDMAEKSQEK